MPTIGKSGGGFPEQATVVDLLTDMMSCQMKQKTAHGKTATPVRISVQSE
jgi:hypothetical protein